MLKTILQIYGLFICAIMTLVLFGLVGSSYYASTDLFLAKYTHQDYLRHFKNNEEYVKHAQSLNYNYRESNQNTEAEALTKLTPEEINIKREAAKADYLNSLKDNAISKLINLFGWFVISIIFFLIHWRIYKRSANC